MNTEDDSGPGVRPRGEADLPGGGAPYWRRSQRPLEILGFLLPLVVAFEIALVVFPEDSSVARLAAHNWVARIFQFLGELLGGMAIGLAIPGLLMIVALLAWQVMSRRPWRIHLPTLSIMAAESSVLAIPLFLLGVVLTGEITSQLVQVAADASIPTPVAASLPERIFMSIGAGLYEELVFRWILIATVHAILADGFKVGSGRASVIAAAISSVLFMLAHQPSMDGSAVFFLLGGAWFALLYLVRGFGIAAGTHVAYDVMWSITA